MKFGAWIIRTAAFIFLVTLYACSGGGGGGGGARPEAPTLALTPQSIKNFHFTWPDVGDETEYRLLEDATGSSGYSQVATIFADETSYDHEVFLPGRINARYILQACNSGGCNDSDAVYVGDLTAAIGYVKASNTGADDGFGDNVAFSADGNTLAVGAHAEDSSATGIDGNQANDSATDSGAVYVFARSGSTWSQQAYVKASNTGANDWFGSGVALSADGNTLAVGAAGEDSNATGINQNETNNLADNSGAAYVFTRSGSTWSQQAYVKASNTGVNDNFGHSVALSADGSSLAVGAHAEDSSATGINGNQTNNLAADSGAVYIFTRSGSTWTQQAYVKASNTGANDYFGYSIALSAEGNTLAVGALGEAEASGAVYVFTRSVSDWGQQAYVKASNTGGNDLFGVSVALSADGSSLAAGAHAEDSSATGIDGDQTDNTAGGSGAVYVFTRSGSTWSQQAYVKASNTGTEDSFGRSVALSADGSTLAAGALGEDSSATGIGGDQADNLASTSGAVYVFTRSGSTWSQQAYVKASNTGAIDYFGRSVALSADGSTLAVGAYHEDSSATGIGGNQADNSATYSGAVYLY
jgi:trimeric autotransporter adhesin